MVRRLGWLCVSVVMAGAVVAARGGDPGDLFPNVNYDDTVRSPVRQPEKHVPPVVQVKEPAPATTQARVPEVVKPAGEVPHLWAPYAVDLNRPFLNAEEQAKFDKDYAATVKGALAGTAAERQKAMESLTEASVNCPPALKRFLLLHVVGMAIKNNTPMADRSARALRVVPLLTDDSLAVAQAKADCLSHLATSAPENATDKLWGMLTESQATLAKYQVQAGFPKVAADTLRKARDAYARLKDKHGCHSELIAEAQAWVDYAQTAAAAQKDLKAALEADAKDAGANQQLAMLYLVLYADLGAALPCAQNATRGDLTGLAKTLVRLHYPVLSLDDKMLYAQSLDMAGDLLEVAKASAQQIERYALACLVADRLEDIKAMGSEGLLADKWEPLHAAAEKLIAENAYRPLVAAKTTDTKPATATTNPNAPAVDPTPPTTPTPPKRVVRRRRGG